MEEYISRDLAKETMKSGHYSLKSLMERGAKTIGDTFCMILDDVPAADVQLFRRGTWHHVHDSMFKGSGRTTCSACGWSFADGAYHDVSEFAYCPNCGASNVAEKENPDPYKKIVGVIENWCDENVYCSFLVTIELDGEETTQILHFDGSEADFVWDMDWWEGEKNVKLLGFKPIKNISIHNCKKQILGGEK